MGLLAERPYELTQPFAFDEPWRWSEIEPLIPYTLRTVDEAPDGKLWFGIHGGILEYDGYQARPHWFKDFGLKERTVSSIKVASDGSIYAITPFMVARFKDGQWVKLLGLDRTGNGGNRIDEAADGSIWMGLTSGLYRFHQGQTTRLDCELDSITTLKVDSRNRLWVLNARSGKICRYDLDAATGLPMGEPFRLDSNLGDFPAFALIEEGAGGRITIAVNSPTEALRMVEGDEVAVFLSSWDGLLDAKVQSIEERSDGSLWILSGQDLVCYVNGSWIKRDLNRYTSDIPFLTSLSNDRLFLGGRNDSAHIVDLSSQRWQTFQNLNYQCRDVSGADWFLSVDKRIVRHYPTSDFWTSFGVEDGVIDKPNSIIASADGLVWVSGSHGEDAAVSWLKDGEWTRDTHPEFSRMLSHHSALESQKGYIYFGSNMEEKNSARRSGGLLRYQNLGDHVHYEYFTPPEVPQRITGIAQTPEGDLWFSGRTLSRMREGKRFKTINTLSEEWPASLCVDASGTLWVGNWRSGLFKKSEDGWEQISDSSGKAKFGVVNLLSGIHLQGIWAVTIDGLSRYDGQSWSHGVLIPDLRIQRRGTGLVESSEGALWINLASRSWNYNDDPSLADFNSEFKTIRYLPDSHPPETFLHKYDSKLHESGTAHFKWKGLDNWSLTQKSDLEYSYRINDGQWTPFSKRTEAVIPSMQAGEYRMEVRARDSDWNIDTSAAMAQFSVTPFLWKRPWFLASMALIIAVIVSLIIMMVRMRIRHLVALEEFKIDFFTRVSHELKTPLSVILGPLRSLLKTATRAQKEPLEMAYRNARRMQGLVDTLLEFRKVELGKLSYDPVRADLEYFFKDLVYSHAVLWEEKNQNFSLSLSDLGSERCFDPEMLQHIISNLLSNAIKYTPDKGSIEVNVAIEKAGNENGADRLKLEVTDNGIGISSSEKEKIFNPFYREHSVKREYKGTGIGLAYTYELVSLWGGNITVESPVELMEGQLCGSRFTVELPLVEDETAPAVSAQNSLEMLSEPGHTEEELQEALKADTKPAVLIVEDNSDVRAFLSMELKERYQTFVATNGKEGIEQAIKKMPDLIITDLMMPEMDGLELCARLKTNRETSHIPLLMLTAKSSDEFRLKGIKEGADDYFAKPVNIDILKARLDSLLESRRHLRERFSRQVVVQPKEVTVTSADEEFLEKAINIMEENMREESFGVEEFAVKIAMGRTSMYRKMKAVTGLTPHEFIKTMRMKRAAQLLSTGHMNVSETYELVGISTISYFCKIFRDEYGCTPSEYRHKLEPGKVTST
ncbi:MAG: response regulator [Verrucomicrobia bacterium]|nr:response regulator [Verrucomicrobiota bacterium]